MQKIKKPISLFDDNIKKRKYYPNNDLIYKIFNEYIQEQIQKRDKSKRLNSINNKISLVTSDVKDILQFISNLIIKNFTVKKTILKNLAKYSGNISKMKYLSKMLHITYKTFSF